MTTEQQLEQLSDAELRRRQILDQAFLVYGRLEDEVTRAAQGAEPLTDEQALAFSFWDAVMMVADMRAAREEAGKRIPDGQLSANRCGWCVRAAGGDDAAWQAAATMTFAQAGAHALVCPHNPLVQELERLRPVYAAAKFQRSLYAYDVSPLSATGKLCAAVDAAIAKEP